MEAILWEYQMTKKALYKHKRTGDLFAIETDSDGNVISTCGPLLTKDIDPKELDYDNYWDSEVSSKLKDFELLTKIEYMEILHQNGFYAQRNQKHLF